MKKNVLIKGILVLIAIALFALVFIGCYPSPIPTCTTATVYITTPLDTYYYYVYIDGVYWGTTNWSGNITLYNVPIGYHNFYAVSTDYWYDGNAYVNIVCGTNNVAIYTY